MSHAFTFGALRTDSLLGYLKTIGVLRTYALQRDPDLCVRFGDDGAIFTSAHPREAFERFFLDDFAPTPVLNPWNKGGGVAKNSKSPAADALVRHIEQTTTPRWAPFREAIGAARAAIDDADGHDVGKDADRKKLLVTLYRARCPEAAIAWIDTAVILGTKDAAFPAIVGSGGNDGRLDFGVTFMEFAIKLMDGTEPRGIDRAALLRDALGGTTTASLVSGSLGQFAPATSIKFNLGNGAGGDGYVNPWDYIFALEGAMAFAGALSKRANAGERATAPFSFLSVAAGFGSASSGEDTTRGELWLPVWSGTATWPAASALLRRGRLEVDLSNDRRTTARSARNSLDAVHGALTLGVASGIDRMERIVFAARNGLAFAGISAGVIKVGGERDPAIAALNRETLQWVSRTSSLQIGAQAADAIRAYETTLYRYSAIRFDEQKQRAVAFQEVIAALGDVARTVALAPPRDHRPLPFIEAPLLANGGPLDDGSCEHRIARAIASLRSTKYDQRSESIRFDVMNERVDRVSLSYGSERERLWRPDVIAMLAAIAERRIRDCAARDDADLTRSPERAYAADFQALLTRELDMDRLGRLIIGYSLIAGKQHDDRERLNNGATSRPAEHGERTSIEADASSVHEPMPESTPDSSAEIKNDGDPIQVPAAFAILRLVIDRALPRDSAGKAKPPIVSEIVPLLLAGRGERALALAEGRLRATGFFPRDVRDVPIDDPQLYAAALIIPANHQMQKKCRRAALRYEPN